MSDQDLQSVLDGEPVQETQPEPQPEPEQPAEQPEQKAEEAPEPEKAEPERGPDGKFAAKEKPEPTVPLSVLLAEREKWRNSQQPPEPEKVPDVFEDQEGFAKYFQKQLQSATTNARLDMSEGMARDAYGDEAVEEAYQAAKAAGVSNQQFLSEKHPWGALVKWHQKQQAMAEIGDDVDAYKAKLRDEIRKEFEAEQVAKQVRQQNEAKAPSLAGQTSIGGRTAPGFQAPSLGQVIGEGG